MLPRQRLHIGVERGQALPPHGMAQHFGLLAHQPAAAWPCCSRHVRFCQGSQLMLQAPVADLLPLKAALVTGRSAMTTSSMKGMVPAFGRSFANLHRLAHRLQR